MQSYGDSKHFPRILTDSSPTCVDNRLNLGQIGEINRILVHSPDNSDESTLNSASLVEKEKTMKYLFIQKKVVSLQSKVCDTGQR